MMRRRLTKLALLLLGTGTALLVLYHRVMRHCSSRVGQNVHAFDLPEARLYDRAVGWFMSGAYDTLAEDLARSLSGPGRAAQGSEGRHHVLDVGAGPGHLAVRLAELVSGVEVTGVDLMPEMVDLATQRAVRSGFDRRVRFRAADVEDLPFPDDTFDLVTSSFSLHHWDDSVHGLNEVRRVLRPGGRAIIYDLPDWLLKLMGHGSAPPAIALEELFSKKRESSLRWPYGLPVIRRYDLTRAAS